VTPAEFHARRKSLGLTAEAFGRLTGVHVSTVLGWGKPRSGRDVQPVPRWVPLLLDAWEAHPELVPGGRLAAE
jgi:hypothetical protein